MYEVKNITFSIIIALYNNYSVDKDLIDELCNTVMLLPNIDKDTEISLLIMFIMMGAGISSIPSALKLFRLIFDKYYNEYKIDVLKDNKFSDIFDEIINHKEVNEA